MNNLVVVKPHSIGQGRRSHPRRISFEHHPLAVSRHEAVYPHVRLVLTAASSFPHEVAKCPLLMQRQAEVPSSQSTLRPYMPGQFSRLVAEDTAHIETVAS